MLMLGDILAAARRSAPAVERWLADADPSLLARLRTAAARDGEAPAAWLRVAVAEFDRLATEEDWATLVSRLRDAAEPGTICLVAMLEWRLARADPVPDLSADLSEGLAR